MCYVIKGDPTIRTRPCGSQPSPDKMAGRSERFGVLSRLCWDLDWLCEDKRLTALGAGPR